MSGQHKEEGADPYGLLHEQLVAFQREIISLRQNIRQQEEDFRKQEQDFLLDLLEIADAFDTLENNMQGRQISLDKSGRRLMKNIMAIRRKLLRLLASHGVEPLKICSDKARIEECKVVATVVDHTLDNEIIVDVQKKGYVDTVRNIILRKAEVVTVCNE